MPPFCTLELPFQINDKQMPRVRKPRLKTISVPSHRATVRRRHVELVHIWSSKRTRCDMVYGREVDQQVELAFRCEPGDGRTAPSVSLIGRQLSSGTG